MTKKLEGNGIWESSRMILPQYRERIIQASSDRDRNSQVILHPDERERIAQAVKLSLTLSSPIRLQLQQDGRIKSVEGIVIDVSPIQKVIRLQDQFGIQKMAYSDVVGVDDVESGF
ncbi:YolD-like family protein [Saccharibacillus sp. JS10]|uniref:YolD-like family protein n=1 Tax=Saccharibacillus sp. JS10 TaxID=2950552 RepID=UPI00210B4988|nr:YolD-like family protein [Saccharibacillus sp. JS10]MCQ4085667.1 YolD-like family protein [Saccharibacillus sp. JS10]